MEQLKESEIADFAMKMSIHPEARDQILTLLQSSAKIRLIFLLALFRPINLILAHLSKKCIFKICHFWTKLWKSALFPDIFFRKPLQWLVPIRKLKLWQFLPFCFLIQTNHCIRKLNKLRKSSRFFKKWTSF